MGRITFVNRYGDIYNFIPMPNGKVLWEGNFKYCRFGYPNDYSKAYDEYWHDENPEVEPLSIEDFIKKVHEFDENINQFTPFSKKYRGFITTNTSFIDMIDPSGGPYLTTGMDFGIIDKQWKGKVISEFKVVGDNTCLIILE
jgi:hypothetical protein